MSIHNKIRSKDEINLKLVLKYLKRIIDPFNLFKKNKKIFQI